MIDTEAMWQHVASSQFSREFCWQLSHLIERTGNNGLTGCHAEKPGVSCVSLGFTRKMITLEELRYAVFAWRDPDSTLGIEGHAMNRKVIRGELKPHRGSFVMGRIIEMDEEAFDKLVDQASERGMILSNLMVFSEEHGAFRAFYTVFL